MLSAIRNFFITLLSALILLGLAGYMVTDFALAALDPENMSTETTPETDTGTLDTGEDPGIDDPPPVIQTEDDSFTILLIGHDYQPDVFDDYDRTDEESPTGFPLPERQASADMLVLMRVDRKTNTVLFCNIPTNARISDMGLTKTLGSLWGEYGSAYLTERVNSLIGIPIDYYVTVGMAGLIELVDEIGGITYRVPQDMKYYDEVENYTINLKKGSQKLNGNKVLQLLRFNGYGDDGTTRRETAVAVLKEIITKIASDRDYYENAVSIYNIMATHVETTFTESDIARRLDLMFLYPEMTVSSIQYPGRTVVEETVIEPEEPETPDITDPPETGTDPGVGDGTETPIEPEVIKTYWYELDVVTGRALFSAYKYTG